MTENNEFRSHKDTQPSSKPRSQLFSELDDVTDKLEDYIQLGYMPAELYSRRKAIQLELGLIHPEQNVSVGTTIFEEKNAGEQDVPCDEELPF